MHAIHETGRTVDRIDNPDVFGVVEICAPLFAEEPVSRENGANLPLDVVLHIAIRGAHHVLDPFGFDNQLIASAEQIQRHYASVLGDGLSKKITGFQRTGSG